MHDRIESWLRARGAVFDAAGPVHFGDPAAEYAAARSGAGVLAAAGTGCLVLTGTDRVDLLHRTTTGDLRSLAPGRTAFTVIQTETARILDLVLLLAFDDDLLAVTGPARAAEDAAWIDRMTIMDDVSVRDASEETAVLELSGPAAGGSAEAIVPGAAAMEAGTHRATGSGDRRIVAARIEDGRFFVVAPAADAAGLLDRLTVAGGAVPLGRAVAEALRLEAGRPAVGRELTDAANPLEAGLRFAIGFEKGCYTGQEVIARMITYKSVKRRLAGFLFEGEVAAPEAGASFDVERDGAPAGRLTSAARSYGLDRWVGLGYVKTERIPEMAAGTPVTIRTPAGPVGAVTAPLPLVSRG